MAATKETLISGLTKRIRGQVPTYVESRALKAYDKDVEEATIRAFVRAVPVKLIKELSGESKKGLDRLAKEYRLPIGTGTVDLYALLPAMFAAIESEVDVTGEGSAALERLRSINADLKQLDLEERRGQLVSIEVMRDWMTGIANIMRSRSEAMVRAGGVSVQRAFDSLIDELEDTVKRWVLDVEEPDEDEPQQQGKKKQ